MPESLFVFDEERASSYDHQFIKLAPFRDALHLAMRMVLAPVPAKARILCLRVGTGAEILALAEDRPQWQFVGVDRAAPMLAICRQRMEDAGLAPRCTFYEGEIDALPESEPFDVATSLLVSHFMLDPTQRRALFAGLAARLRPGGLLINADLAGDSRPSDGLDLLETWVHTLRYTGLSVQREMFVQNIDLRAPDAVASMLAASGFEPPVQIFQSLLMHAWYARRRTAG